MLNFIKYNNFKEAEKINIIMLKLYNFIEKDVNPINIKEAAANLNIISNNWIWFYSR